MLIGIAGNKGVGKDTAAQFLIDELGYTKLAFADQLKRAVAALFDIPIREVDEGKYVPWMVTIEDGVIANLTWRSFLQRFGTEMGREVFGHSFWVDQWSSMYDALFFTDPDSAENVIVPDVRFPNEAKQIMYYGGHIIRIDRPGYTSDGHVSEEGLPHHLIDTTVHNDGHIDDLRRRFLGAVKGLEVGVIGH